ncbi:prolipoprotein diacylglyceryl transferase [Nonomuraea jabiensis]|uniref:Phosphatidylglycerol--prolipoprotein diacylglyceryl transferase n=1 Tax=Nonomuraea jabiensis TaxID=882448 RepID=A0A7W9G9Z3_9ACTN|nr:prolipoprotein diacylglyceryl transferase [Nonomuraea jabiensis]
MLGVIVAVWLSERRWQARGGQKGTIVDIAVPAVIFGLIGGRLYHVITDWQTYFGSRAIKEPIQALFIWEGGLGIWGAISLGALGVWFAVRKRGISMSAVADTVAPGIAFAQAIGRWGNWFNQELYGSPTTLPWGLEIDVDHGGEPGVLYHPTFLYESLWDVALGFVLIFAGRRFALHHGRLFALYVAGYTLGRFWIEGLRIDPVGGVDHAVTFLGLRINQWTSIVLFVAALAYFWLTRNRDSVEIVAPAGPADPAHPADQADADSEDTRDRAGEEPASTDDGESASGPRPAAPSSSDAEATDDGAPATDKTTDAEATDDGAPAAERATDVEVADDGAPAAGKATDAEVTDAPAPAAGKTGKAGEAGDDGAVDTPPPADDVTPADGVGASDAEVVTKEKNSR